jgi:hypothetical protein
VIVLQNATNHRIEHASIEQTVQSQFFSKVFTGLRLNNRNDIVRLCHTTNNKAEYGQSRKAGHLSTLGQCLPDGGHVFKKEDQGL